MFGEGNTAILPGAGQEVMTSPLHLLPQREDISLSVLHEGQHLRQPGLIELRLDLKPFLGFFLGAVCGPALAGPQFDCRTASGLACQGIQGNAGVQEEASVGVVPSDAQLTAAVIADVCLQVDLAGIVDDQQVLGGGNSEATVAFLHYPVDQAVQVRRVIVQEAAIRRFLCPRGGELLEVCRGMIRQS